MGTTLSITNIVQKLTDKISTWSKLLDCVFNFDSEAEHRLCKLPDYLVEHKSLIPNLLLKLSSNLIEQYVHARLHITFMWLCALRTVVGSVLIKVINFDSLRDSTMDPRTMYKRKLFLIIIYVAFWH